MNNIVREIIPLTAVVLVVGGLRVALEGVIHQDLAEAFPFGELPGSSARGDRVEGQGLDGDGILGESLVQDVNKKQENKEFFHKHSGKTKL